MTTHLPAQEHFQILVEGRGPGLPLPKLSLVFSELRHLGEDEGWNHWIAGWRHRWMAAHSAAYAPGEELPVLDDGAVCQREVDCWDWHQVGHVFCNATTRVQGSGGGWRPDPLLPPLDGGVQLREDFAESFWVQLSIPRAAAAGKYLGTVSVVDETASVWLSFDLHLRVWDLTMPLLGEGSFSTIFSFNYEEDPQASEDDAAARPSRLTAAMKFAWFDKLTAHRLPPDDSTLRHVRSVDDILYLARAGARWINLLDVSRLNAERRSQFVCETVTDEYLGRVGDALAPVVAEVKERGLFDRVYVYGFDEDGPECEPGVRALFGGLKERFPGLRTASTLRFGDISEMGLPLDILICHVRFHNETAAQRWMDSGSNKTYMLYHSIEPSGLGHLNSFIERPAIDHRLILWQAAALSEVASGWLFWAVNAYAVGCPANPTPHGPVRRLNGTARVDFNPGNCIWWPKWDFWANGDGQLVYPGQASKPLGSIRLASFLDGVEDVELLRMLPPADRLPLARRMVSAVDRWATPLRRVRRGRRLTRGPARRRRRYSSDPALLEQVRRAVASKILQNRHVKEVCSTWTCTGPRAPPP